VPTSSKAQKPSRKNGSPSGPGNKKTAPGQGAVRLLTNLWRKPEVFDSMVHAQITQRRTNRP
jgi:hypothetical protein